MQECPAQQCFPFLELQAIAFLPQHPLASLPQQPFPPLAAHCFMSFPAQHFIAEAVSLVSFLQQAMSLPSQQEAFDGLPSFWSFICAQHAQADLSVGFAESSCATGACACGAAPVCCGMAGSHAANARITEIAIIRSFISSPFVFSVANRGKRVPRGQRFRVRLKAGRDRFRGEVQ